MRRLRTVLLAIVMVAVTQVCFSQAQDQEAQDHIKEKRVLFILKADEKTVQINNWLGNRIDMDSLDVNSIRSVEVLKDKFAVEKYGEEGKYGVVILRFIDYASLSNKTKKLFDQHQGVNP